ncbi:MAG: hypothetical protein ACUVWZ_14175 [Anaerolineae bacterium]
MVRAYQYAKAHWQPWIGVMSLIYMPDVNWTQDDEQYWWSIIEPSKIDELRLKAPYVTLCSYIRQESEPLSLRTIPPQVRMCNVCHLSFAPKTRLLFRTELW